MGYSVSWVSHKILHTLITKRQQFRSLPSRQILVPTHSSIIVQRQKIMTC